MPFIIGLVVVFAIIPPTRKAIKKHKAKVEQRRLENFKHK
jgi:hypothetical protein